ncbi:polysaccharide deacetylase family protein [Rhodococcus pyridinivorans]|uniref:polysaccharide deacetylase family protein n=1 Tax=Rhodococcus pyridinivorans TaxID=103816 RepID=UPI003D7FC9CD
MAKKLISIDDSKTGEAALPDAVNTALRSTYATQSELSASFRPAFKRQRRPAETVITNFQAGHGWSANGSGGTWDLNYTADAFVGTQCVRVTTAGTGVDANIQKYGFPAINLAAKEFVLPVKIVSGQTHLSRINVLIANNTFANSHTARVYEGVTANPQIIREGEWFPMRFTLADQQSTGGTPNLTAITDLRITVVDKGTGPVVVQLGKLAYYPHETAYPNGAVTLWFDDCIPAHRTFVAPYLAQYGFAACEAVICEAVDGTGMTLAQLRELQNLYGWEICSHSYTFASHTKGFDAMTAQEIAADVDASKTWFSERGFTTVDHFAYPRGMHNANSDTVLSRYFSTGRTTHTKPVNTMLVAEPMRMSCYLPTNTATLASVTQIIDRAYEHGAWLHLGFHDIVDSNASSSTQMLKSTFTGIIDYLATKGSRVVTVGAGWNAGL